MAFCFNYVITIINFHDILTDNFIYSTFIESRIFKWMIELLKTLNS